MNIAIVVPSTLSSVNFSTSTEKWSPALQIRTVLLSIQALLSAPNPDDPLANDVAEQWKVNEAQAIETGVLSFCFTVLMRPYICYVMKE